MGIKKKGKRVLSEEKKRGTQRRGRDSLSYKAREENLSIPDQDTKVLTQLQHALGNTYIKKVMAKFATEVNGEQGEKKRRVYRRALQDFRSLIQPARCKY